MKNLLYTMCFVTVSLAIILPRYFFVSEPLAGDSVATAALSQEVANATWDWQGVERVDQEIFFDALRARGITTVYVDIGDYIDIYELDPTYPEKQQMTDGFEDKLMTYISLAQARDLQVQALAGHTEWGNASHWYISQLLLDYVLAFNQRHPETAFVGMQFDIESYNQPSFSQATAEQIFNEYLDLADVLVARVAVAEQTPEAAPFALGFAIPYWLDGENEYAQKVTWRGEEKYVFYHLLNRLNTLQYGYLVIMAYRTAASGGDGVLEHSKKEVQFMQEYTPRVTLVIGQETTNVEPAKITYYHVGFAKLLKETQKIIDRYKDVGVFTGFAFNDADSFLELE